MDFPKLHYHLMDLYEYASAATVVNLVDQGLF